MELFIRANWDVNTDLQHDPNATWYVDGNYNFGFNLSTSNENVNSQNSLIGEQGRNVLNDSVQIGMLVWILLMDHILGFL